MAQGKNFQSDDSGVAIIEFALILPVLLLIVMGVIEYGTYFMRNQVVQRTINSAASSIQLDATDTTLQTEAYGTGGGLVNYQANGNYICAKAYATSAEAKSGLCNAGDWKITTGDAGVEAGTPYYVALVAYVQQSSLTGMFTHFIPSIRVTNVVKVGSVVAATQSAVAWMNFPPGTLSHGAGVYYDPNPPISPDEWCESKGYSYAAGCRGAWGNQHFQSRIGTLTNPGNTAPRWYCEPWTGAQLSRNGWQVQCVK